MKTIIFLLVSLGLILSVQPSANAFDIVVRPDRGDVTVNCHIPGHPDGGWSNWAANINAAQTLVLICEDQYGGTAEIILL